MPEYEPPDQHGDADHQHGPEPSHGDADHEHRPTSERRYDRESVRSGKWVTRAVLVFVFIALAYVAFAVSAAFFPRWWAHRVGDQVGGQLSAGTLWGLFYGFVFTLLPLLVIAQMRRRFFNWIWRLILLAVAVLLATPNWLTLAVVLSGSKAAHAGERTFDVEAPGFRVATTIGAVAGAVVAVVLVGASVLMARRRRELHELRGQLRERDEGRDQTV